MIKSRLSTVLFCIGIYLLTVGWIGLAHSADKNKLIIGTGGTGGSYYPYGGAMAKVFSDHQPSIELTVQATGGAVENVRLLAKGHVDLGMAAADVSFEASRGSTRFPQKIDLRILFAMAPSVATLVVLEDSPIKSYEDIKGKKIAVGPPGSGTEVKAKRIFDLHGISYKDFKPQFLSFSESVDALKDRNIEGTFIDAFSPVPALMELATTHKIRLVDIKSEVLKNLVDKFPYHSKVTIPAGMYRGVDRNIGTFGTWCHVLVMPNFSKDLAYGVVKTIMDHRNDMEAIVKIARFTTPENGVETLTVNLHPGAERYFKERGIIK